MRLIELDARSWKNSDDFYDALLPEVGAPNWHGRNLNALEDSIFIGDINAIEPPFEILITGTEELSSVMKQFLVDVRSVFTENAGKADARISFSPPI